MQVDGRSAAMVNKEQTLYSSSARTQISGPRGTEAHPVPVARPGHRQAGQVAGLEEADLLHSFNPEPS